MRAEGMFSELLGVSNLYNVSCNVPDATSVFSLLIQQRPLLKVVERPPLERLETDKS